MNLIPLPRELIRAWARIDELEEELRSLRQPG